ncbi:hypothetical protein ACFYVK_35640 [Streptomyces chartreusis]|uniref:hypothetical protein n=1 Tax=Streptomyces chartreusis TaxID=1969 RepID=UPI0036738991
MSQNTGTGRPGPNRALMVLAGVAVLAAAVGGFAAGRETAPAGDSKAGCASTETSLRGLLDESSAAPASEDQATKNQRLSTMANLILQNPDCFDAETRAQAQTAKDQIAAGADAQALSDAAARAAQCADPNRLTSVC